MLHNIPEELKSFKKKMMVITSYFLLPTTSTGWHPVPSYSW